MIDLPHKIQIPQRPHELISRPRLNALLQTSVQRKLVTLIAPAGYGKTSLLIDLANITPTRVCWYTLDMYDADPWMFLSYLTAAIDHRFPGSVAQTTQIISGQGQTLLRSAVATLMREISAIRNEVIICFDDWHLVDEVAEISDLVVQIVSRCPNSHVVLASRSYPSLPNQMLLAARRQMVCIDENQLRFYADELAAVITAECGTALSVSQAEELVKQSDGWISGVLLALQAARGNIEAVLAQHSIMSRPVQRFLAEQIFDSQPPDIQQFLCETAMLEDLTAESCNALLGRSDAGNMLERLLALRLFISEPVPGVLRYHPLFRDFLYQRLRATQPARFHALGLQVAADYARQGHWSKAFDLCSSIGDLAAARQLLHSGGENLYLHGRLETIERAFTSLPPDALDPTLLCLKAKVELDRGRTAQSQLLLEQALSHAGYVSTPQMMLLQAVLDRIAGHYEIARDHAQQVLQKTDDPALQGEALRTMGISLHRLGQTAEAITTLQRAQQIEQARGATAAVAQVQHELVVCYHAIGNLSAAEEIGRRAEVYWSTIGNQGRRALTRNSLALNQALTGRYAEAFTMAHAALRDAQDAAIPQYEVAVLSTLGDMYADLELWDRAISSYETALRIGGTAFIRSHILAAQVYVLVQQGYSARAEAVLSQLPEVVFQQQAITLLLVRAQIAASNGDYATGLVLAQQALEQARAKGVIIDQIRALMMQAWLYSCANSNDDVQTLAALHDAAKVMNRIGGHCTVAAIAAWQMQATLRRLQPVFPLARIWLEQQDQLRKAAVALAPQRATALTQHNDFLPMSIPTTLLVPTPQDDKRPVLRARYLGDNQVWIAERSLALGAGHPRDILAYLIAHPQGASRAELYRAIWCAEEPGEGSNTLSRVIYRLRSALPEGAIVTINRDRYHIDRSVLRIEADIEEFELMLDACVNDPKQVERVWKALELYQGPFLGNTESPWCMAIRSRLERRYRQALRLAAETSEQISAYQKALELFHQIVGSDPTNIAAHAGIMRSHIALGEPAQAIAQYHRLTQALDAELGLNLDPDSEPERLYHALLAV